MKRSLFLIVFSLVLVACGSDTQPSDSKDSGGKSSKEEILTEQDFEKMYSDPEKYKGSTVEFYARVFVEPEKDEDGTYLQAFANNNSDRNVMIGIDDPDLEVNDGDIIYIEGTVDHSFEGTNLMGGTVTAPAIWADEIEVSDYATAFSPAVKTIDVDEQIDQHGYQLTLNKIEIAEEETRLYVSITNNSNDNISFYSFNSKIVSGDQQLESEDNYEADYPQIKSDILPDVKEEGIIVFPPLPEEGSINVFFEGSSDDYSLDFTPFEFEIEY